MSFPNISYPDTITRNLFHDLINSFMRFGGSEKSRLMIEVRAADLLGSFLLGLLGQKNSLDVGQNTALSDSHAAQQLVQFFVVAHSQLKMPGNDSGLLVVTSSVTSQLQNFSRQVF